MSRRLLLATMFMALVPYGLLWSTPAVAGDCSTDGGSSDDFVTISTSCSEPGEVVDAGGGSSPAGTPDYLKYQWRTTCRKSSGGCGVANACVDPGALLWQLWGLAADDRQWHYVTSECLGAPPTAADTPQPQITPGLVLTELKRIGLPQLTVQIQPAGKTLVNFDTNFYVIPQPFNRTITLLGRSVDVEATPTEYTWLHGDGTSATTTEPGAPYPDLAVTYAYQHAGTVAPSVRVTYAARFRVEGGAWQQIPDTVTVDGPPGSLQVSEGTGVLSGDYQ